MCIPYAPRDRDVAIRLTCALLGAWTDNRDNLADLYESVHSSVARINIQSRESLVRDVTPGLLPIVTTGAYSILKMMVANRISADNKSDTPSLLQALRRYDNLHRS